MVELPSHHRHGDGDAVDLYRLVESHPAYQAHNPKIGIGTQKPVCRRRAGAKSLQLGEFKSCPPDHSIHDRAVLVSFGFNISGVRYTAEQLVSVTKAQVNTNMHRRRRL